MQLLKIIKKIRTDFVDVDGPTPGVGGEVRFLIMKRR